MRKYFIVLGFQRKGPYTIEELKEQKITKESLIWFFELGDTKPASEIEEIAGIFENKEQNKEQNKEKAEKLAEIISSLQVAKNNTKKDKKNVVEFKEKSVIPLIVAEKKKSIKKPPIVKENKKSIKKPLIVEEKKEIDKISLIIEEGIIKEIPFAPLDYKEEKTTYSRTATNDVRNRPKRPKNYLLASILSTIFCCLPLGIIGLIFASQVDSKYRKADYSGAEKASKSALTMIIIAFVLGLLGFIGFLTIGLLDG